MDETTFDQELEDRLSMLESPDGTAMQVSDLPTTDLLVAIAALALATVALLWWAY
ncbi:hypothetical protein [Mycobacterium dioxanotrophicus]|uniref:hypothetical protein n=1 Tax=Mycobacterium dioxanotrophicus TaxID=482462 RepID=UPI0012FB7838|nr:hypothetical protein [Mycobacterium dioxanotrophicus]